METKLTPHLFRKVKDGIIIDIKGNTTGIVPEGYEVIPHDCGANVFDHVDWFDPKTEMRITDDELVKQGKRKDNRHKKYYDKKTMRESGKVYNLDEEPGNDVTDIPPIENETFQSFDEKKNKWIVDTAKKERAKKESDLSTVKYQIKEAEEKLIRPLRAIQRGRATDEDNAMFEKYDDLIENELRPKLTQLDKELKSA